MVWTGRAHGHLGLPRPGPGAGADRDAEPGARRDFGPDAGGLGYDPQDVADRRAGIVAGHWSWLDQVHGAGVVIVGDGGPVEGTRADALVTRLPGAVLAVFTADCAPVALASPEGVVGVVHAGWRGLQAGVIGRAVEAMRGLGASSIVAALGPCIRAGCYEFGGGDLERLSRSLGDRVRATTMWGTPALDLAAAVEASLGLAGADLAHDLGACTACSVAWYSHRARQDTARQATAVWLPA